MPLNHPRLILITSGFAHPSLTARRSLRRIVEGVAGRNLRNIRTLDQAFEMELRPDDLLVLYYHRKMIGLENRTLVAMESWLRDGGRILAVHSATASYKGIQRYFDILGGRFTGHKPVSEYRIRLVPGSEEPFSGIGGFSVRDELYRHELRHDITVQMTAEVDGIEEPVVWTRRHGAGRVCYIAPGHREATLRRPHMKALIEAAIQWLTA